MLRTKSRLVSTFARIPSRALVSRVAGWDRGWGGILSCIRLGCSPERPDAHELGNRWVVRERMKLHG
jgi:hypothetical protein